jgi:iron-sulfur cluster repair protein YtfE (RIC family)
MPPTLQSSSPVSDSKRAAPPHNYSTGELITYIIERFHNKYRRDLPGLSRLLELDQRISTVIPSSC